MVEQLNASMTSRFFHEIVIFPLSQMFQMNVGLQLS